MKVKLIHFHPGWLRLRVPALKKNPMASKTVETVLTASPGILKATVNTITGSLLIVYQPLKIHHQEICQIISKTDSKTECSLSSIGYKAHIKADWHVMDFKDVLSYLESDSLKGLTDDERNLRLVKCGYNDFAVNSKTSLLLLLLAPFKEFMGQLLLGIGFLSILTKQYYDAIAIVGIIGIEAVLGVIQGIKAEKSINALRSLATPRSKVLVSGEIKENLSVSLVPGDVILVEEGDIVPADCRLIKVSNLLVDESVLTGESFPVEKENTRCSSWEVPLVERNNMLFKSARVVKGNAYAVVVATGAVTEIGQMVQLMDNSNPETTPLQKELEHIGKKIAIGSLLLCGGILGIGLIKGRSFSDMIRTTMTLAVGVIPEGLPTIVTIALVFGAMKMAKKNAIIRNLSAVEAIGNTTVICTDKTGTLTTGEMTVRKIYADDITWDLTAKENLLATNFSVKDEIIDPLQDKNLSRILIAAALCNNTQITNVNSEKPDVTGEPTEVALMQVAIGGGIPWAEITDTYCRQKEIAFDAIRKMMTVVCTDPEGLVSVYTKGALDEVLAKCDRFYKDNKIVLLDSNTKADILANNDLMAKEALRVLAFAYKPLDKGVVSDEETETNLIFLGLMGMADPVKPGVFEAIQKCYQEGIKVVMITGDHSITARAVADEIGLSSSGECITGSEIDKLSDQKLLAVVKKVAICARATPEHKLRLVKAFKESGYIVAMTGDGVNDAPAVREAHIGIAMGQKGTDVTREAAAVTLADDNFATVVQAIEDGRGIKENIRKSIQYVLSGNFGEVVTFVLAVTTGMPLPLVPSQIIFVNFLSESIPILALGSGEAKSDLIKDKKNLGEALISVETKNQIIKNSLAIGLTSYGLFLVTMASGSGLMKARTMALSNLILNQQFNFLNSKPSKGLKLLSIGVSAGFLLSSIYSPMLRIVFQTAPLGFRDWGLLLAITGLADTLTGNKKISKP